MKKEKAEKMLLDSPKLAEYSARISTIRDALCGGDNKLFAKKLGVSTAYSSALPVQSNAAMNRQLKEIGLLCGITEPVRTVHYVRDQRIEQEQPKWKLLSTHCARRTFVVHAIRLGIPAEVIMKWTGHSGFSAMKPYVAIVDELKAEQMRKFNVPPPDLPPEIDHATLRQDVPNPQPLQTDERLGSGNPDTT